MDILLDSNGDLKLSGSGDIILANSVSQKIKIRIRWFLGEWRWNREVGLPYFENLFQKRPDTPYFENLVKNELLAVDEVTDAVVTITSDPVTRKARIQFTAYTEMEAIREEVVILG